MDEHLAARCRSQHRDLDDAWRAYNRASLENVTRRDFRGALSPRAGSVPPVLSTSPQSFGELDLGLPTDQPPPLVNIYGRDAMATIPAPSPSTDFSRLPVALFIPDTHRPFHSPDAWAMALEIGRLVQPKYIIIQGDFADFYRVSDHVKDPALRMSFRDELADVNAGLDELDALGAIEKIFVEGNHEHRLARHLLDCSPDLYDLPSLQVPELFNLRKRGWSFSPYADAVRFGNLWITHDDDNAGPMAHTKARASYSDSVVIGHTHRMALEYRGNALGEVQVAAMFGWLGDLESIHYMKKHKSKQWQHGVGLGFVEPKGTVHLRSTPFIDGVAVVDGHVVRAPA